MSGPRPAPDDFAETVPEIVAQLRKDPVLVEDIMSNGHTAEVKAALDAKAADAAVPVYVVLTRTPRDISSDRADEELVNLLHSRLGEDGVYYVATSDDHGKLGVWGDLDPAVDDDTSAFESAHSGALAQVREAIEQPDGYQGDVQPAKVAEAALALDVAASDHIPTGTVLTDEQVETYTGQTWIEHPVNLEQVGPLGADGAAIIATAVGVTVAAVAYRLLQAGAAWSGRGSTARPSGSAGRSPAATDLDGLRQRVDTSVGHIDRRLETAEVPDERVDLARNSRDTALRLRDSDDTLDVVGALVLARTGAQALSDDGEHHYRCCYVNPLHGDGRHTADVGGGLKVPVCGDCRSALAAGRTPDALIEVRPRARDLPYYVGDTVWARTGFGSIDDRLWASVEGAGR